MAAEIGVFLGIFIAALIAPFKDFVSGQSIESMTRPWIYMSSIYMQSFLGLSVAIDLIGILPFGSEFAKPGQIVPGGFATYLLSAAPCLSAACRLTLSRGRFAS